MAARQRSHRRETRAAKTVSKVVVWPSINSKVSFDKRVLLRFRLYPGP